MSALLVELEKQACSLLPEERAHLAEVLLESLHAPLYPKSKQSGNEKLRSVSLQSTRGNYKPIRQRMCLLKQGA